MKSIPLRPAPPSPAASPPPGPQSATPPARWTFARLATAPHRLGFFGAAVLLALSALWWALALATRHAGIALPWAVPPPVAHGLAMALSFMPLFIVGFMFTAGPRWLGLPDVPARTLVRPVVAMAGGWTLAILGFHVASALAAAGVAIVALGWGALLHRFVRLLRASRVPDRLHAGAITVAAAVGLVAMAGAAAGLALDQVGWTRAATQLALWGFLAPTFATVSHRMIPFFTASALPRLEVWRPNGLLAVMLATLGLTAAGAVAETLVWPLQTAVHAALLAVQAPAAVLMLWLALRWGLVQSLGIRLLAMLHAGFVWLGVSLALAATSHALVLRDGEAASLGLAPLHALTMGYLGCTLVAMITRVAAGHSGRPLAADGLAWALYLAVQAAAVMRVGAALWPAASVPLTLLAATAWLLGCAGWAWRYGGWMGRPRIDGRPG